MIHIPATLPQFTELYFSHFLAIYTKPPSAAATPNRGFNAKAVPIPAFIAPNVPTCAPINEAMLVAAAVCPIACAVPSIMTPTANCSSLPPVNCAIVL